MEVVNVSTWLWSVGIQCLLALLNVNPCDYDKLASSVFKINKSMCTHTKERSELTVHDTLDDRPNLIASSCICEASSRVGAKTNTVGPNIGLFWHLLRCTKAGIRYPSVFPDPVLAIATISRFWSATGHVWAWIGVGFKKPAAWTWMAEQRIIRTCRSAARCYLWWKKILNAILNDYGCLLKQLKAWRRGSL
jgi:hypothetical protein